ncbi:quinone oxidoreductase family protein [Ramlibacter rhizophilus]|uniref:Zinc-binding alcohol dehydrogenase family protein n=1 Tax=Ramlibacter rhizophilus TaxID=1781167 RepID=A0A4Z0C062_9BURK|nr:zinc-binding alcohol dehydrogenase family protein [Ramlibacter rhizophilus]TFZ04987.1 zinc-binding alcohol dehydrogenase family protein [Ramlibacter rhizophilus]
MATQESTFPEQPEASARQDSTPGRALRLLAKADSIDAVAPQVVEQPQRAPAPGHALVRIAAAAVNPSDAKAALGLMPQAAWPRTPGRDYAGTVVAGPAQWLGRSVYGSGGDVGITRDGSHACFLELPVAALRAIPSRLSMDEAAAVGVPFATACEGFLRSGWPRAGQVVLVLGANGKVGQAAVQLAAQAGARVLAVQRRAGPHPGFACTPVEAIDASACDVAATVRDLTGGRGADLVFNTVGSPYFEAGNKSLAKRGTQIFIATQDRAVPFDIFAFYRGMHTFVGVDSLALDCVETATRLDALHQGFAAGTLRPFPVARAYSLDEAAEAYRAVLGGSPDRVVLHP